MNSDDNRYLKEAFGDDKKKKWLKDNPTLTPNQIDSYIKRFDVIRKSRPAAAKNLNIDVVPKVMIDLISANTILGVVLKYLLML